MTVGYRRYRARRAIYAACGAVAAAGAIWVGTNLYQMFGYQGEKDNAASQTAQLDARSTRTSRASFRRRPRRPRTCKKTVEIAQELRKTVAHAGHGDGPGEPGARGQSERRREGTGLEVRGHGDLVRSAARRPPAGAAAAPAPARDSGSAGAPRPRASRAR